MSTQSTERWVVLAMVGLVLLSGCAAFTEPLTETPEPSPTPTDYPSPAPTATLTLTPTPTATMTPSPTPSPTPTATPTPTPTESVGQDQAFWNGVLAEHSQFVNGSDSWQGAFAIVYLGDEEAIGDDESNTTFAVTIDGDERRQYIEIGNMSLDTYTAGNDEPTYTKNNNSGSVSYSRQQAEITGDAFADTPFDPENLANWNLRDEGIVETHQGTRHKYAVHELSRADPAVKESYEGEITNVSFEVYVHPDNGAITEVKFAVQEQRAEGTVLSSLVFRTRNFGTAAVTVPDWLEAAKEETS